MESLVVFFNSDVSKVASESIDKMSELKNIAERAYVSFIFYENKCRIEGRWIRTVTVPKKITKSSEELAKWIEKKILTAWK